VFGHTLMLQQTWPIAMPSSLDQLNFFDFLGAKRSFNPVALFGPTDVGFLPDIADLTTLFQDSAGTLPVTAPGQPVGLVLDKSKGLALGPELWAGQTPTITEVGSTSSWTPGSQMMSTSGGSSAQYPWFSFNLGMPVGGACAVNITLAGDIAKLQSVRVGGGGGRTITPSATISVTVGSIAATSIVFAFNGLAGSASVTISSISVRQLIGNHATQSVSASRPTYGRHPKGGVRNLLTYTEDLSNVAWSAEAGQAVFSYNTHADLTGAMTLDTVTYTGTFGGPRQPVALAAGVTYTVSFDAIRISGSNALTIQTAAGNFSYGTFNPTATLARYSVTFTAGGPSSAIIIGQDRAGGGGLGAVAMGRFQVEVGSTATAYQKVTSTYDVTEAGKADAWYLSFDGVDDSLVTPAINWGTDKATIVVAVHKASDSATAILAELSANYNENIGTWYLSAPNGGSQLYGATARGNIATSSAQASLVTGVGAAPDTAVISAMHSISGDSSIIRRNGVAYTVGVADKGTGNFGNYPLYIGRRGGSSLPFKGLLYGMPTINRSLSNDDLLKTEAYAAALHGVVA